jgi:hypothetical protein
MQSPAMVFSPWFFSVLAPNTLFFRPQKKVDAGVAYVYIVLIQWVKKDAGRQLTGGRHDTGKGSEVEE